MQLIRFAVALAAGVAFSAYGAIYKTVDSQGNAAFSDEPSKGAQVVNLPPLQTVPAASVPTMLPMSGGNGSGSSSGEDASSQTASGQDASAPSYSSQNRSNSAYSSANSSESIPAGFGSSRTASPVSGVPAQRYNVVFLSPMNDQTYVKGAEPIIVAVSVSPNLSGGATLSTTLDGIAVPSEGQIPTTDMNRGEHTLVSQVRSAQGRVLASTAVTINVYQASRMNRR